MAITQSFSSLCLFDSCSTVKLQPRSEIDITMNSDCYSQVTGISHCLLVQVLDLPFDAALPGSIPEGFANHRRTCRRTACQPFCE